MYGYTVTSSQDPLILVADESGKLSHECILPGASLINVFPVLRHIPAWMPGAVFHAKFQYIRKLVAETKRIPWEFTRHHAVGPFFTYADLSDGAGRPKAHSPLASWETSCRRRI